MTVRLETIQQARPFASLPPAARQALAERSREIEIAEDDRLIPLGRSPERLLVLIEGLVKLVGVSVNGHERILCVHKPGDVVGPGVLLDNVRHDYEAAAMSPGRALSISRRDLLIVGRSQPAVILALAKEVSSQLAAMTERIMSATSTEVPVRISRMLLDFADGHGNGDGESGPGMTPLTYPLTHEIMAQIVGASRPHTSTVLRDLEGIGAVKRKSHRGLLVRPTRLREIVELGELDGLGTLTEGDTASRSVPAAS